MTETHVAGPVRAQAPPGPAAAIATGVVMVAFGLVMVRHALEVPAGRDPVSGPRLFPLVITVLFTVFAGCYLAQQVLGAARGSTRAGEEFGDVPRVVVMVVLLVAYGFVLEPLGYVLSTFALFVGGARLLGSRRLMRDTVVGAVLSVAVYLLFTRLLSVHLPGGLVPLG